MNEFLLILLFIVVFIFVLKFSLGPHKYLGINQNSIENFLWVLLYRGFFGGTMLVYDEYLERYFFVSKFKHMDQIGLNLHFPYYTDLKDQRDNIESLIKKFRFDFITETNDEVKVPQLYIVNLKQEISRANDLIISLLKNVFNFEDETLLDISYRAVSEDPKKFIGFKNKPVFYNTDIDLTIPVTRLGYILRKIGTFFVKNKKKKNQ